MNRHKNKKSITIRNILAIMLSVVFLVIAAPNINRNASGAEPSYGNYYTPDYDSKEKALEAADNVNQEICEEGFTLLKNEDNALPLGKNKKISLFGKSSSEMFYGLSSNYVDLRGNMTPLHSSLKAAGFNLNPSLINFYNNPTVSGTGRGAPPTNGARTFGYKTGETPVANYTPAIENTYSEYNDAAVVMFSRSGGEGWDLPRTMEWDGKTFTNGGRGKLVPGARSMTDHYLQLDQNEADLLKYVGSKFSKVVVVLNTPSQFETGFLDDVNHYGYHKNIKAAIWMGYPGRTGVNALGRILNGEVNPSGKTVDTWARDFKADPTWENFADNRSTDGNKYSNLEAGFGSKYVIYKEGIYIGYRYYETRGFTEGTGKYTSSAPNPEINGTTTKDWNSWYNAHVVYPFGHGLSYTTFSKEITNTSKPEGSEIGKDDTITVSVKVTNTGAIAGKETALIFYTAPYDNTSASAIEKSSVVLGGFGKTKLLAPKESETLKIKIKVRDMASYDFSDANSNGFKGYELDKGTYELKLMNDAHTEISKVSYTIPATIKILTDDATNNPIVNQFDEVSNYLTDSEANGGLGQKYMSRRDFVGTFPTMSNNIEASQAIVAKVREWTPGNQPSDIGKDYYVPEDQAPTFGDNTGAYKLADLIGLTYDDPKWEVFLNQISLSTSKALVCDGDYRSGIETKSLGIPRVINAGQPAGYMSLFSGMEDATYAFFSSDVVTASTFNRELAHKKGIAIGNEALFGTGRGKTNFPGWYAPAADTHRSPFGGRNADYFSEDGMLAGEMASGIIQGAMEKGVFCFFKHFAVNDQECDRIGLITWANEQSMREIYFKPFEIGVKVGKTSAIMSALNRIGGTWAGGSYELLTNVLRKEWGFCGMVVTDSYIGSLSYTDQMVRAGGDLELGNAMGEAGKLTNATALTAVRNSCHNILYVMANSMAMNTGYATPPQVLNDYTSVDIPIGSVNLFYSADISTVTFNPDAFDGQVMPSESEIKYALKQDSTLPKGLELGADGIISGTPTEEATAHKFLVEASYGLITKEARFFINITNTNGSIIYTAESKIPSATIGKPYSNSVGTAEIYKHGATPDEIAKFPKITYALKNGSALPDGLTLNTVGEISGTPTKECQDYVFTVVASALGFRNVENDFTVSVFIGFEFTGKTLLSGKIGNSYLDKVSAEGSDKNIVYKLKPQNSLPNGLTLTSGGTITGEPMETVNNRVFVVIATADYCEPKEAEFIISIGLSFNKVSAPDGAVGEDYYSSIDTAQGAGEVKYTLKEGSKLPKGLTLSENGIISGKANKNGAYTVTVVASSSNVISDEMTFTINITGKNSSNLTAILAISISSVVVVGAGIGGFLIIRNRKQKKSK